MFTVHYKPVSNHFWSGGGGGVLNLLVPDPLVRGMDPDPALDPDSSLFS
jgi:hypothetical protein